MARPEGLNYTITIKLVAYKNGQCCYKLLLFIALQIIVYIQVQTILANQKKNTRSEGQQQQVRLPKLLSSTTNLHILTTKY